ncbi:MAG: transcription antitermination factor NusB [Planctomycetota bacterium]
MSDRRGGGKRWGGGRTAKRSAGPTTARDAAAVALGELAERMPDVGAIELPSDGLTPRDAALAADVYRLGAARWLTCEAVAGPFLKGGLGRLDPAMRGVLVAGVSQLLFRPDLAAYAVVDEAVESAKRVVHPRAAGMANAVMRRVAERVAGHDESEAWSGEAATLPWGSGGVVRLSETVGVKGEGDAGSAGWVAAATGVPARLLEAWREAYGWDEAVRLGVHAAGAAPVIVQPDGQVWRADEHPGGLRAYLAEHPEQRVQDPTAAAVLDTVSQRWGSWGFGPPPEAVWDACAGRGTKARQMRAVFEGTEVWAYDPTAGHRRDLGAIDGVRVGRPPAGRAGLVLFDVPCSNTGVLARRPEARHRYSAAHVRELVELQRAIVEEHLPVVGDRAVVVYATCSIEPAENRAQADWLATRTGRRIVEDRLTTPGGGEERYHDGGYFAVLGPAG